MSFYHFWKKTSWTPVSPQGPIHKWFTLVAANPAPKRNGVILKAHAKG